MKEERGTGRELPGNVHAAPVSPQRAQRASVIEPVGQGIKVRNGQSFDPYRFQEFEFSPAFREKMMRAPLPLLDVRQLQDANSERPVRPDDTTQPAGDAVAAVEERAPDSAVRRFLRRRGLAKAAPAAAGPAGKLKGWKSLIFGSSLPPGSGELIK